MAGGFAGELRVVAGVRGGAMYADGLLRGRLLSATFALVGERGYEGVSARSVSARAGVSNRAFYQCFSDREDCFLAAFNHALDGLELELREGWESELGWTARVRAALAALLAALDREPAVRRLVFVEALGAGPRVLARRARVLESLAGFVDEGRVNAKAPRRLPGLVAEGVVGATFGVIHARLLELRPEPLVGLLGQLMAMIVLPYRGSAAAARELGRPAPKVPARRRDGDGSSRRTLAAASPTDYRLTVRTQMALAAVGGRPGLNNREVSEVIGLSDQGQVSRMMKRLQGQGLVENAHAGSGRLARAWRLTADGEAVIDSHEGGREILKAQRRVSRGGKLVAPKSARRGRQVDRPGSGSVSEGRSAGQGRPLSAGRPFEGQGPGRRFRMTALTHEVLGAVANLSDADTGPSNREIAAAAGVKDEGQISKLLSRLEGHGLLENQAPRTSDSRHMSGSRRSRGVANAWRLTARGEELTRVVQSASPAGDEPGRDFQISSDQSACVAPSASTLDSEEEK
ncbi:MAG: TetR family transcriptional regulator [Solirubrobacteraceae bacterium]